MRAVVQRVKEATVAVDSRVVGQIGLGLLVLVGVGKRDQLSDAATLAQKIASLRIFEDEHAKMNLDVRAVGGAVLAVSQFTLFGDVRRGSRPSLAAAMSSEPAKALFEGFCAELSLQVPVQTGRFGAHMVVTLQNDGPVTLLLDTERTF